MNAQLEATKEILRYAVLLIVSWIITGALQYVTTLPQTETTAILLIVLRWLDKYLYVDKGYKLTQF
jgi:hypothetical protein